MGVKGSTFNHQKYICTRSPFFGFLQKKKKSAIQQKKKIIAAKVPKKLSLVRLSPPKKILAAKVPKVPKTVAPLVPTPLKGLSVTRVATELILILFLFFFNLNLIFNY